MADAGARLFFLCVLPQQWSRLRQLKCLSQVYVLPLDLPGLFSWKRPRFSVRETSNKMTPTVTVTCRHHRCLQVGLGEPCFAGNCAKKMTTRAIVPRSSRENGFAHARHKTEVQNASAASSAFVSNCGMTRSSQSLTLSGCRFACVQTFCSLKALFTEKPISNSCRVISAQSFGAGGLAEGGGLHTAFCNTLSNWLWTRSDINNRTDGFLQNGSGPFSTWGGRTGGRGRLLATKEFFLWRPRAPTLRLVGPRGRSGCS